MAYQSRLELAVDSRSGEQSLRRFRGELNQTERQGTRSFGNLRGLALGFAGALSAIGVTTGIRASISTMADFQAAMNGLAAVSGATADQMATLEGQARTLGATSQFSAQQAAEAQRFLAQAGFEVNEVLGATPGILQLATAGSLDLASAADIASNVLGGMRMEVSELSRVNDVLAATAARSNTTIEQLGQALSFAAPFAASAGVELEEVAAAIGVMSDAGIQASRAGTGMVGVIRQLSRVTPAAERALNAAGLSIDQVNIGALGLETVLDNLRSANLDTAAAIEIFGSEAGAAAQVLVNDYKGAITGATGEAERMANQMDQGLLPAFKGLGSAVAEATLQMGDSGLAGSLETLVRTATGVVSSINGMSDEFNEANGITERHNAVIQTLTGSLQVLAALAAGRAAQALATYTAAKVAAIGATTTLNGALIALRTTMLTAFGPVGVVVAAAGVLYTFREELNGTASQSRRTAERVDDLTNAINTNSEAAVRSQLVSLTAQMFDLERQAIAARERIDEVTQSSGSMSGVLGVEAGNTGAQGRAYQELAKIREEQDAVNQSADRLRGIMQALRTEGTTPTANSVRDLSEASGEAALQAGQLERSYESLLDRLYPIEASQRRFREEMELLDLAAQAEAIDDLADAQQRLRESFGSGDDWQSAYGFDGMGGEGEEGGYWERWLSSAETAFTDFDQLAANTAENFQRGFGNAFESMIFDASSAEDAVRGMADGMLRSVVNAIGQMIAQELAYQAVVAIRGQVAQTAAATEVAAIGATSAASLSATATTTAAQTSAAATTAAAWTPAAIAASIGSFGAAAAIGLAAVVAAMALGGGFRKGGYTGNGGVDEVAGVVHGREYVFDAASTARIGVENLEAMRSGKAMPSNVVPIPTGGAARAAPRVTVNLFEDAERAGSVEQESMDDEEIINVFVANIASGGDAARAIEATYGVNRQGR